MDRRQRKTREAIFNGFTKLLFVKKYSQITVGDIIEAADIGRATFYAHFETKDYLLKDFCQELFCHIFDAEDKNENGHKHIFHCDGAEPAFEHLFRHLQQNDNNILILLSSQNNELFLSYFKGFLVKLVENQYFLFEPQRPAEIPEAFWKNHIVCTLSETLKWWIEKGMQESPERITEYFFRVV